MAIQRRTLFSKLPVKAQREIGYPCGCPWCVAHPEETPKWDTFAIQIDEEGRPIGDSWVVHYPELSWRAPTIIELYRETGS